MSLNCIPESANITISNSLPLPWYSGSGPRLKAKNISKETNETHLCRCERTQPEKSLQKLVWVWRAPISVNQESAPGLAQVFDCEDIESFKRNEIKSF